MSRRPAQTPETPEAPYSLRHIEEMLGLSRGVVMGLVNAGFVAPARGPRNELRFTFQDVVLLRTAHHLRSAQIPPKRLLSSLKSLRERLPPELPLTGLRIKAIGNEVAVKEGLAHWGAESGQLLMDFEVTPASAPPVGPGEDVGATTAAPASSGSVMLFSLRSREPSTAPDSAPPAIAPTTAQGWYLQAEALDMAGDPEAAEASYREALALAPEHVYAAVNLGAMLCENDRFREAIEVLIAAIRRMPDEPLLHYNAAIALEDLHRPREALVRYEACLRLAPDLEDAHHNAAKLCERLGDRQGALRHYSAFRRLQLAANQPTPAEP